MLKSCKVYRCKTCHPYSPENEISNKRKKFKKIQTAESKLLYKQMQIMQSLHHKSKLLHKARNTRILPSITTNPRA